MINAVIIDDEPINISNLEQLLKVHCQDINVLKTASNALEGEKIILKNKPDLVVLDIQMPGLDGFGTLSELRKRGFDAPIIALTAHAMKEDRDRAFAAGFTDHLTKPINSKFLLESIQSHLKHSK
mgnify:CR=1 FL=1